MKNKKKKINKPSPLKVKCADIVKEYLSDYAVRNSCTVEFKPESYEEDFSLECTIRYDGFLVVIDYIDNIILSNFDFDFCIRYQNSDECFSIYDIFNLFDIKDFNYYYYNNCIDKNSIIKALDGITGVIDKNYYDIKKAGNQEYLPRLIWQCKDDMKKAIGQDWLDDHIPDFTHISYLTTTAKSKEKLIEKLEKQLADDELVLYERRLLQYLKDGYDVEYTSSHGNESDKIFRRIRRKVSAVIVSVCAVIIAAIEIVVYKVIFNGAYVPFDDYFLGLPFQVALVLGAFLSLSGLLIVTIGKLIAVHLSPDDVKEYAKAYYKSMNDSESKIDRVVNRYFLPIGVAFMAVLFLFGANINIGFYDDYFKLYYSPEDIVTLKYEDVEFARVLHHGSADDYDEFDGICYAIMWKDDYYTLDECEELGKTDKTIQGIADAYGKEIKEIDNIDILADMYYSEEEV